MVTRVRVRRLALRSPDRPSVQEEEEVQKIQKEKQKNGIIKEVSQDYFENETLNIKVKDYYFSNVIARSSKTMLDCYNSKIDIKRTGTEG